MGGSGGGGYFIGNVAPGDLAKRTRQAEEGARDGTFETEIGKFLGGLLAEFNDRDVDGIQEVFDKVKADIKGEVDGTIDTLFGGSIAKHTYVDGISDVDALVVLSNSALANQKPEGAKAFLAGILRDRYGASAVSVGTLAVTVSLKDKTVQLLPALREKGNLRIPSNDGTGWSRVNPDRFAAALTAANQKLGGKLIPCIKLVKAIVASLPEKRRPSGYHTEAMALRVFGAYKGPLTTKAMLRHFFEESADRVKKRIADASGQSMYVDEYLGSDNSLERRIVADALGRVGRKIRNADGARSPALWRALFE